ncbi:MAG: 3-keto-5-aminohexanoate cleavage protein [Alphaproteobacteria bacterium]|jgi:3-keto-5-aminohexanoate cleavage enzyme|nr:3-keto-5-aminohexanoate cleavage protein [Alphaproteobacteria bacterium]HJP23119.1 3-keto-5-aminohexanoate cleavage protein [Alphaproteobacteria bacterium]
MSGERTIITCALTGAQQGKTASPALPEQPDEIIAQSLEAWRAGAAILHLHARDANGKASGDPAIFRRITGGLREAGCEAVLNLSTGGAVAGLSIDQRLAVVPELKPEIASFSVGGGSMLGRWDETAGEWLNDRFVPLFSSHAELERVARMFQANGTRPELEVYHSGMLNNIAALDARGVLQKPLLVNLVTGIPGECNPGTVRNLLYLVDGLPPGSCWLVSAIGARNHFRLLGAVVAMGGHIRVGLEDNLYLERGRLAASNGEIVEKAVRMLRDLGGEPASPAEARKILDLKGGDAA